MLTSTINLRPPIAKKEEKIFELFGDRRVDAYYWMRLTDEQKNAANPDSHTLEVVNYLEAENHYTETVMQHLKGFRESLYAEMVGRIKQTDMSVPYLKNGYFYLTRYEEGQEYPVYERKHGSLEAKSEPLIDVNELAIAYDYYDVKNLSVSPDNTILAFGEDKVSRRQYDIRFKNLNTGAYLSDIIENTTGLAVWASDNKTIFYTRRDETLRPSKIYKHVLGTPSEKDELVYHEADETFNSYVYKSRSGDYIIIASLATVSNEYRILKADDPGGSFHLFTPRRRDHEYNIAHHSDHWYIKTNKDGANNFMVMRTSIDHTDEKNWMPFIAHDEDILVEGLETFRDHLVISHRIGGNTRIMIRGYDMHDRKYHIDFAEDAYYAFTGNNPDYTNPLLRLGFTSMTTPMTTYDFDTRNKKLIKRKQQEVVGNFNADEYQSERLYAPARDGERIPISIVYKKGFTRDGKHPLLLYGYGSYGHSMEPYFSSVRLSLLDRGFVYAIAHVRGGEEMGRSWYENGKLLSKKNTFKDFIDCARYLKTERYADPENVFAMGGSAGGLLMGAVMNMAPDLWKGIIAAVPFVDVVTTMLDTSIPLTTGEYDEWGNPGIREYYKYIRSYSPIDNIEKKQYPATLVTTGYHDSQVQYWEPAKWVAKLRDYKTDNNPLLLYTNMEAGHGGKSGRFQKYVEIALEYAFILALAGIEE